VAGETKQLIEARVARLVGEFGDEAFALFQSEKYCWEYVGRIKNFLDDTLTAVDSALPVTLVMRQRPSCLAAAIALWAGGRCVAFVSPIHSDHAIAEEVSALAPAVVIAEAEDWVRSGFAEANAAAVGIKLGASSDAPIVVCQPGTSTVATGQAVPADHAATVTTSGTTGAPKRYALVWDDLKPSTVREPSSRRGALINTLPLFSIGGVGTIAATIFGGRPIALMDHFDVKEWAGCIRDHQPRRAGAPPAVLRMVLDAKIPPKWFASLETVYTASAPLPVQLADEFELMYGVPIVQGYGATEFLGAVTGWPGGVFERWGRAKRGSVGRPLPGVRLRVVDHESCEPVGVGEVGNLEVDTPHRAQGVPSGWVATNDVARIDQDGFVWIIGRSDDVIIRGGFKVSLPDVEAALLEDPRVLDACVVGAPDDRLGEVPAALIVTDLSDRPDEGELIAKVRDRLPAYMAPALVSQRPEMPLNSMLKKDRKLIKALLAAELAERRERT
jgi:acyl-coenzyme A synthetase/AMP-(fatty) acid ligase